MKHIFRFLVLGLVALFMVVLTNYASSNETSNTQTTVAAANGDYSEQVQAGVDYFKAEAEQHDDEKDEKGKDGKKDKSDK